MEKKIRVCILCGGKSGEHEVSLQSAKNIIEAIDRDKYEVVLIGIDKNGGWSFHNPDNFLVYPDDPGRIALNNSREKLAVIPGESHDLSVTLAGAQAVGRVDVVFPVLHGPFGEDGTVQGLLKLADMPFVGAGVLGSAAGMDKDVMKRLLRDANLPIGRFFVIHRSHSIEKTFDKIRDELGLPIFVKPANLGSSVGVNKVYDRHQFEMACREAFQFDHKIIVEEFIRGKEIECSVLGNLEPIAAVCGEVVPQHDFYSYEAKYIDENGAVLKIPADLPDNVAQEVQRLAIKTFQTVCCEGLARVDFFVKENNEIIVNEINTIPGFTRISMYPRLWEASGIPLPQLVAELVATAQE